MQYDKTTQKTLKKLGLKQEKGKPGWKLRMKNLDGKWQKFGLKTKNLEEVIAKAQEPRDDRVGFLKNHAEPKVAGEWDKLLEKYLKKIAVRRRGLGKPTETNIRRGVRFFRDFVKKSDPLTVTRTDMQRWHDELLKTIKPISVWSYISWVRPFFMFLQVS